MFFHNNITIHHSSKITERMIKKKNRSEMAEIEITLYVNTTFCKVPKEASRFGLRNGKLVYTLSL